jgi:ribosomal-protein-alanine N-acetyltransferase
MIEPLLVIRTPRLVLRPFVSEDLTDTYIGWLNDPEVVRYSNQRFRRHDHASCKAYLESYVGSDNLLVIVQRTSDGMALGTMSAYRSRQHGTADVGILMGQRATWGQGYGQEAWSALLDWLAMLPGMRKVTCGTLACNHAMRRLAERSGMHHEATRRDQELVDGKPQDILYFARFTDTGARVA